MKKLFSAYFGLIFTSFFIFSTSQAQGLNALYQKALEERELIQVRRVRVAQSQELRRQAMGSLLPSLNLVGGFLYQDPAQGDAGNSLGSVRDPLQKNGRLTLAQPLFRGMAEFAALEIAEKTKDISEIELQAEKLDLYSQLAEGYFTVLLRQREKENLKRLATVLERRVAELQRRVNIGRAKEGDLFNARSQLALNLAEQVEMDQQWQEARRELSRLVGIEMADTSGADLSLPEEVLFSEEIENLSFYISQVDKRPDVELSRLHVQREEERIRVERSGHFPTLNFEANYHFFRTGLLQNNRWDVGVAIRFPLFQGGVVSSRIRQATQEVQMRELQQAELYRQARLEVENWYERLQAFNERVRVLQSAVDMGERNYQTQSREFNLGIISYLEVVQAESTYWEMRRTLDRIVFQRKLAWIQLNRSIGKNLGKTHEII
jgi:outer membrane protein